MNYRKRFVVEPGAKVRRDKIDPGFKDKHDESHKDATQEIQNMLSAWPERSICCTPTASSHCW
jgi:hypothetical protein